MNDFTKDELEVILLDMTCIAEKNRQLKEAPFHLEIRNKLQSLIDNYCEHEWEPNPRDLEWYCSECGVKK